MCWWRGVVIIYTLCPDYMPLAPQMRHAHFLGKLPAVIIAGDLLQFSPPDWSFLLGRCATVSNPYGARERAPGHRVPLYQPDPPHQGVPGGGAPVAGDTLSLPLCVPQVLTSQTHCHSAPSHLATRLAGATGGFHLSWHPFPGYPWMMKGPLGKGYMPLLLGRARRLSLPSHSAPAVESHLRTLH